MKKVHWSSFNLRFILAME